MSKIPEFSCTSGVGQPLLRDSRGGGQPLLLQHEKNAARAQAVAHPRCMHFAAPAPDLGGGQPLLLQHEKKVVPGQLGGGGGQRETRPW